MTLEEITQQFQSSGEIPTSSIGRLGIAQDVIAFSVRTVLYEFSRVRPIVGTVDGTAGDASVTIPGFGSGCAVIGVESPSGEIPESWIASDSYVISLAGTVSLSGAAGAPWRVHYRRPHASDGSTLTEDDLVPLFKIVAADLYAKLAAYHAETQKPEFSADAVNYQSKTREYLALAKAAREAFYRIVGTSEDAATIAPAETSAPTSASWRIFS